MIPEPGTSELGWLADLKEIAEEAGSDVYGERIRWDVEALAKKTARRPDVVIRRDSTAQVIASGEAKRPDTPKGVHPLVATEVRDAIEKAEILAAPICFTTNFFHIAVFDAQKRVYPTDLDRLQGGVISLIPESLATAPDWWTSLGIEERKQHAALGLRQLFERLKLSAVAPIPREIDEATLLVFSRTTERLVAPLYDELLNLRRAPGLPSDLVQHALRVHLQPQKDAEARYLVAQGVAEVLTATLFYRNIADHFSLDPLLGGTDPKTAGSLNRRVSKTLEAAINRSGDYETIFRLSPAAQWVLLNGGTPVLEHWKDLFGFVEQLDFTSVSSDIIGSIFERLISPERRHAMGQHYTQPRVARAMSQWAVRAGTDHVADVACGAGTFLVEVYKCLAGFGLSHQAICAQTLGNDIDPFAVHLAAVNLATRDIYKGANYPAVRLGDAFEIKPGDPVISVTPAAGPPLTIFWPPTRLDAVVGNPPYAESPEDVRAISSRLRKLGLAPPATMSGGNLAAWFALLAAALLKDSGRFTLVMPTAVLQNENLSPWRAWLRNRFDVTIWHTEDDVWFSDARVAVCVILAQPKAAASGAGKLVFVDVRDKVAGTLEDISGIPTPSTNATVRDISSLPPQADVFIAGTYPDLLRAFASSGKVQTLRALPEVTVYSGNKLGHECFQLRDLAPDGSGTLREVEGYQMRVRLNDKYLTPLFASPKEERTGEFSKSGTWVLSAPTSLPAGGAVTKYIRHCERLKVHEAPSIKARGRHWWHVEWKESQVVVQIHPGFLHQVWWSPKPFVAKNNFHILLFTSRVNEHGRELIAASMASAFGALAALYISSEVGCEGVRWLSSTQFEEWPVLDPDAVSREDRDEVLRAYGVFRKLEAVEIHAMDAHAIVAWQALTAAVGKAAGLRNSEKVAKQVIELARQTCVRRTQREKLALSGRTRAGGAQSGAFLRYIRTRLAEAPETPKILQALSSGEHVIRLRPAAELDQGTLDLGDVHASPPIPGEKALSLVLGARFECAPAFDLETPDKLGQDIRGFLEQLVLDVLGPAPTAETAEKTYLENARVVHRAAVDWFQKELRNRLG